MKKISALELVNKPKLECNIYDEEGQIIHPRGYVLTPDRIMQLSYRKIFIDPNEIPVEQMKKDINLIRKAEIKSIIPEQKTASLIRNAKNMLFKIFDDKPPEEKVCNETRDTIIEEVSNNIETIDCIGQLRIYDEYTYSHTINVSSMATALAILLGYNDEEVQEVTMGALLHDIGKMQVAKTILNKPAKLTEDEFFEIRKHTVFGYKIIKEQMNLKEEIARVALEHQEKYSGFGYPSGLKGDEIHKYAQIAAVCDVYDALVSKRVYKEAVHSDEALQIMIDDGEKSFNPKLLYKFIYLANYKDVAALKISANV